MKWRVYPEYKGSGIEWLSDIPRHWETTRLGYEATIKGRLGWKGLTAEEYVDEGYVFLATPNIKPRSIDFTNVNFITEERYLESPEIILQEGDVLLAKDGSTLGITNIVRELPVPSTVNSSIAVVRPGRRVDSVFLHYVVSSTYIQNTIQKLKDGQGVPHLFQDDIRKFHIWLPGVQEQHDIATFLDRETGHIDALIAKKERQIELLQEKRSALISHVVTKGLDPSVKMKDSGIEWLGEIPEHWKIRRAKVVVKEVDDRSLSGDEELLSVSHIRGVTRRSETNVTMFMAESLAGYKKCQPGDLVINTMWAWMGAMGVSSHRGIVSPSYNVYRFLHTQSEPWYYDYLVRTGKFVAEVTRYSKGVWTSRLRLYPEELFAVGLPCPPKEEQRRIVEQIRQETGHYDKLQGVIEMSIKKLREYRSALISAAVTGKIDVRREVVHESLEEGHCPC